ncbi:TAXI family TRAP transporter solute-binding subunit [Alsobacter sp. SYSU BS001988]
MTRAWLAAVLVGAASAASAQTAPAQPTSPETCNALCQLFKGLGGDRNPPGSSQAASRAAPARAAASDQPADKAGRRRTAPAQAGRSADAAQPGDETGSTAPQRQAAVATRPGPDEQAEPGKLRILTGPGPGREAIVADLGAVLGPETKVDAVSGRNAALKDLLTIPGVDMAVVSAPVLAAANTEKLVQVAKLFGEELHVVAGPDVTRIEDLAGKPVHLGRPGSDTEAVARAALQARGVEVVALHGSLEDASADLREGRAAAFVLLAPKPFAPLAQLDAGAGAHLVAISYRGVGEAYDPSSFTAADYPAWVRPGERVETLAADAVLVAPWWRESSPRQKELTAAARTLFERFPGLLREGRHPKWKETNLAAAVDRVRRLKTAQLWVQSQIKVRPEAVERSASAGR